MINDSDCIAFTSLKIFYSNRCLHYFLRASQSLIRSLSKWFGKLKFHLMEIIVSASLHLISFSGPDFFHDLLPHRIPISPLNCIFGDLVYMQNAPKRQSQLLIISYCFSKSDANFMQIASANMYINLSLTLQFGTGYYGD